MEILLSDSKIKCSHCGNELVKPKNTSGDLVWHCDKCFRPIVSFSKYYEAFEEKELS